MAFLVDSVQFRTSAVGGSVLKFLKNPLWLDLSTNSAPEKSEAPRVGSSCHYEGIHLDSG